MSYSALHLRRTVALTVAAIHALLPVAVAAAAPSSASAGSRKPNIVVIVADDLGYADIGANGGREIPTPNIDSIAKNGVRFTSGYVSGPYCSPTRAGLLTGRYQQRFGHEFNPGPNNPGAGLPLTETTLADRLKGAGYRTGLVGKWHLGFEEKLQPLNRGFDEFFGFLGGAHSYTNSLFGSPQSIYRGTKQEDEKEYLTDAFTREALSYIDRNKEKPFFLYLAYNAVHGPLHGAQRHWDRFPNIADEKRRTFATMLSALDEGVGKVLGKLREHRLEDDTLIVFFSDNGGPTAVNTSRNDFLRGFKAQTWEGGIRIPFLVQWKGRIPAAKVVDAPVIQLDVNATALVAAGIDPKPEWNLDGTNLVPFLAGQTKTLPHETLYWRFGQQFAIRQGDWKLVKATGIPSPQLFNLSKDLGETTDLSAKEPAKFKQLEEAWTKWSAELKEPAWGQPNQAAGKGKGNGGGGRKKAQQAK